jgi:transposase InsO family protein
VERACDLLEVSRSGFYAWRGRATRGPSNAELARQARDDLVAACHEASHRVYGVPRVTAQLRCDGHQVSRKAVQASMRRQGLQGISPRPWKPVTTLAESGRQSWPPDLVDRSWDTGELNKVWTSDITYLPTGEGWLFLAAVRDGCSRRVIGYAFADTLHTDLVVAAVSRAVMFRGVDSPNVILHADRGCQYTSTQMALCAEALDLRISVGRTGVCWDNAQQESFWSTLKTEFYNRHAFATRADAITAVSRWIDQTYNHRRLHSALGMQTPAAYEQQLTTPTATPIPEAA